MGFGDTGGWEGSGWSPPDGLSPWIVQAAGRGNAEAVGVLSEAVREGMGPPRDRVGDKGELLLVFVFLKMGETGNAAGKDTQHRESLSGRRGREVGPVSGRRGTSCPRTKSRQPSRAQHAACACGVRASPRPPPHPARYLPACPAPAPAPASSVSPPGALGCRDRCTCLGLCFTRSLLSGPFFRDLPWSPQSHCHPPASRSPQA